MKIDFNPIPKPRIKPTIPITSNLLRGTAIATMAAATLTGMARAASLSSDTFVSKAATKITKSIK